MKKGFTLIEIMIVVAIIAILAAIAIPNFLAYRQTSQQNACKANMKTIKNACEAYVVKNGSSPSSVDDLAKASDGNAFIKSVPTCPYDSTAKYSIEQDDTTKEWTVKCSKHDSKTHNVNESTTTTTSSSTDS